MRGFLMLSVMVSMLWASVSPAAQNLENHRHFKPRNGLKVAACKLTEEGSVAGQWKNLRIEKNGEVVSGADRFDELIAVVRQMNLTGECAPAAQTCELQSEGSAAGAWQKHRIFIDGAPVMGANDMGTLLNRLAELRTLGFCG